MILSLSRGVQDMLILQFQDDMGSKCYSGLIETAYSSSSLSESVPDGNSDTYFSGFTIFSTLGTS